MLGFIYTIKVFDIIYVMTQGGPANDTQTFATWSYMLSFSQQLFGQGAAQANMILLISLVVTPHYRVDIREKGKVLMQLQVRRLSPLIAMVIGILLTCIMLFPLYWM